MLSDAATFGWGAVGAVVALLVVQVLPWAIALAQGGRLPSPVTAWRVFGVIVVLVIFALAGGLVALLFSDETTGAKEAIAFGLGWQGLLGGVIQGTVGPGVERPQRE